MMTPPCEPSLSLIRKQSRPDWLLIGLVVLAIHLGAVAVGLYHPAAEPKLKVKPKVFVQTVHLNSPAEKGAALVKTSVPSIPLPKSGTKEKEEKAKEKALDKDAKKDDKVEVKKAVPESKAPPPAVKKTAVPAKPATPQAAKPKAVEQPQKKQVDDKAQIEKKQQQDKAELQKKQEREKAEADKVNRKKAEEEKEKQARLAVALGALGKSKQSRENLQPNRSSLEQVADPKAIGSLEIDVWLSDQGEKGEPWSVQEVDYRDKVGATLKTELKLPEFGAVTIRLTLSNLGKVIKVESVNSQSAKNKGYVEKTIPTLSFPPFGKQFKGESQCTFSFILKNNS